MAPTSRTLTRDRHAAFTCRCRHACRAAAWFLALACWAPGLLSAADNANRTLFGNEAVRRELQLTPDQTAKIDAILADMERDIASKRATAKKAGPPADGMPEDQVVETIVDQYGARAWELLDKKQALRLWQIGAQGSGPDLFSNNRVRRALRFTPDQIQQMRKLGQEMIENVKRAVPDVETKGVPQEIVDREKAIVFRKSMELLTPEQRKDLDELLGEPFDQDLLSNTSGKKPRALTFVFGITGHNPHCLLGDPRLKKELDLSNEQNAKIQALLKHEDESLTAVRLGALKPLDAEFPTLAAEDKRQVVRKILDSADKIYRETDSQVAQLLSEKQLAMLDRALVQAIGARALGCDRVAARLNLSNAQKQAFGKAVADFERQTAPMRVIRSQRDFPAQSFDQQLQALDEIARSLLTPTQAEKLQSIRHD